VRSLVEHPSYTFGIVAALVLAAGVALGWVHVLAERSGLCSSGATKSRTSE